LFLKNIFWYKNHKDQAFWCILMLLIMFFLLIDWQILFLAKFGKENSAYILEGL